MALKNFIKTPEVSPELVFNIDKLKDQRIFHENQLQAIFESSSAKFSIQQIASESDVKSSHLEMFSQIFSKICRVLEYAQGDTRTYGEINVTNHYLRLFYRDKKPKKGQDAGTIGINAAIKREFVFAMTCCNPGFLFTLIDIQRPISIILTSGTLSPIDTLESDLQIPIPNKLSCSHVISKSQVFATVLGAGINNTRFNFNFRSRLEDDQDKMMIDLGHTVANICLQVRGGILVFFPSYKLMKQYRDKWQILGVLADIKRKWKKTVLFESNKKEFFQKRMREYLETIATMNENCINNRGAVLMGVCRGKVSEGIDFSDDAARCVIVIGMPFPQMNEPRVILKQHFLNSIVYYIARHNIKMPGKLIDGTTWYQQQASRTVNQTVGRVIRHVNDYGAIFLADERYRQFNNSKELPGWVKDSLTPISSYKELAAPLQNFISINESRMQEIYAQGDISIDYDVLADVLMDDQSQLSQIIQSQPSVIAPQKSVLGESYQAHLKSNLKKEVRSYGPQGKKSYKIQVPPSLKMSYYKQNKHKNHKNHKKFKQLGKKSKKIYKKYKHCSKY
ncbi:hypothetical protein FGO68_gene4414 [Halteria grandinella]|uniref:ATP-dependent helicase C-terminal domain-containing protein n=1 Tax=Halteria grandinella TaxID=5974 RepID=A0A8J8T7M1_HALGN|nr:hypothetical protein FGO68_gene4414 [Halteria grandinella]